MQNMKVCHPIQNNNYVTNQGKQWKLFTLKIIDTGTFCIISEEMVQFCHTFSLNNFICKNAEICAFQD